MSANDSIKKIDAKKITVATICSHSALQIFLGAKQEGFRTLGICKSDTQRKTYEAFPASCPDEFMKVNDWHDVLDESFQEKLLNRNVVIIPHGSFVEYVGSDNILKKFDVPMFGNKHSLEWESDRKKQREWLEKQSGLKMPKQYTRETLVDGKTCFVKFGGAKGGRGFFTIDSKEQLNDRLNDGVGKGLISKKDSEDITIQEYVLGNRYYHQFFFSPLSKNGWEVLDGKDLLGSLSIMGIDRRDETNVDELHRIHSDAKVAPSYTVVGNIPLVARESQLPKIFDIGERVVRASHNLFDPGIIGPFCLETFCTPDTEYITFEISCRIVAGTNLYPDSSPYTVYSNGDSSMSTGRRIAQEIKLAAETRQLGKILS